MQFFTIDINEEYIMLSRKSSGKFVSYSTVLSIQFRIGRYSTLLLLCYYYASRLEYNLGLHGLRMLLRTLCGRDSRILMAILHT